MEDLFQIGQLVEYTETILKPDGSLETIKVQATVVAIDSKSVTLSNGKILYLFSVPPQKNF